MGKSWSFEQVSRADRATAASAGRRPRRLGLALVAALAAIGACNKDPAPAAPTDDKAGEAAADKAADKAIVDKANKDEGAPGAPAPGGEGGNGGATEGGAMGAATDPASASAADPKSAKEVDFVALGKAPADFVGKLVRCLVLIGPSPVAVGADEIQAAAGLGAGTIDDRRTTLFCKTGTEGLQSTPVLAWFPEGEKGGILDVDRDTVVALEIRGSYAGQPVGVFRGIVEGPRRPAPGKDDPDLLSALLWPDKLQGQTIACRTTSPAMPVALGAEDDDAKALIGAELAPRKALLRCADARGGSVGVTVYFGARAGASLLQIGNGTVVDVLLRGFARNQLVASFSSIRSGGLEADTARDPLRSFLLDPAPQVGKDATCRVLIAPSALRSGGADEEARSMLRMPLDPTRTTLACAAAEGNVPVDLYFPSGKGRELLRIGSDAVVRFQLWGVAQNRVVAMYQAVESGALELPAATDWRALTVDATPAIGKELACEVLVRPFVGVRRGPAVDQLALFQRDGALADTMAVLNCKDHSGAAGGTRVEAFFAAGNEAAAASLAEAKSVKLSVRGAGYGVVLAMVPRQ